jgi:hypothetical protein
MSMAVTRFEMRKQLVLEEADAIRDAHLRTQLLPTAEGQEIADLLRAYVNVRIPSDTDRPVYDHIPVAQQEAVRLQNAFWQRAVAYGQRLQHPELASLLLQSLNKVIDLDAARWMAFQNQVPEAVICVIGAVSLLAAVVMGYTFGPGRAQAAFLDLGAVAGHHARASPHHRYRLAS